MAKMYTYISSFRLSTDISFHPIGPEWDFENDKQIFEHDLPGRYALEPNHTHYIFFDDGTYNSTDNGEFASKLARRTSYGARRRIPLVTILVGGKLYALRSIWADLIHQVSVVIVDQSGSLANIFCKYLKATKTIKNLSKKHETCEMTDDDQIRLAFRWSIPNITEDQLLTSTMNWNDSNKIEQNRWLLVDGLSDFMYPLYGHSLKVQSNSETSKRKRKIEVAASTDVEYGCELNVQPSQQKSESINKTVKKDVELIYRDIFLWCILTYRLAIAKIILGQMKTRICSALIASKILKSLTYYAPDHGSKERLHSEANVFETYAIEFVRCSYVYNKQQTCELIIRQINLYGDITCLQMAIAGDNKKFLNEDACQALLTNIWYDKIDPVQERTRLVINLLTMGVSQLFISMYEKHFYENRSKKQETNFYFQENRYFKGKILTYFDWNNRLSNLCLLLPAYILFYVGLILRFVLTDINNFSAARIVMAYDLELWFIIAVLFVSIGPNLGPKLVMIRKMTNDLLLFIIVIVVFIFGYGITSRSMTAYGTIDFDGQQFFRNVVYPVYYFILGNFDSELSQLDEMISAIHYLDKAWSEFERFSTNDYIRQLVDAQTNAASSTIMTDIPSELLATSTDESKWLKSDINQLKDELTRLRTDTSNKSLSMESTVAILQNRIEQIDNRFDRMMAEMTSFQDSLNWMMRAMARANMDKDPPLIVQKS
ncbi:unnamed protein product, partial [Rotaria sordida]